MKRALICFFIAFGLMACATKAGRLQTANIWGTLEWEMSEAQLQKAYPSARCEPDDAGTPACGMAKASLSGEPFSVRFKFSRPAKDDTAKDSSLSEMRFTPIGNSSSLAGRLTTLFQKKYGKPRSVITELDGRVTMTWQVRAIRTRIVINAKKDQSSVMKVESVVYTLMGNIPDEKKDAVPDD